MTLDLRPTAERVRHLFSYDEKTGIFVRRVARPRAPIGSIAGTLKDNGYLHFSIDHKKHGAHRVAWLYVTGEWPQNDIDHLDGTRANNAFLNLRDVTRTVNLQNMREAKGHNKSTGMLGAYLNSRSGRYTSRIQVNGVDMYLGSFDTAEEAHVTYLENKRIHHEGCTI